MSKEWLPNGLKDRKHDDWLWPFSYAPRAWTAFEVVKKPELLLGTQRYWYLDAPFTYPMPIPPDGEWQLSITYPRIFGIVWRIPYFAFTLPTSWGSWHFRIGCRWDDVDNYYEFPEIAVDKHT